LIAALVAPQGRQRQPGELNEDFQSLFRSDCIRTGLWTFV
jgi:hypothetical protein